ncbi:MAG: lipocalin family protein, partial [Ignavibacteriaceae bacterium]|nr:lipocalin family protein [Ignavibacteriaceae bacterium]
MALSDVFSKGVWVDQSGQSQLIEKEDVVLEVTGSLGKSGTGREICHQDGTCRFHGKEIDLKITPAVKNQLMDVAIRYWEGSVKIEGTKSNTDIRGRGYVELTG